MESAKPQVSTRIAFENLNNTRDLGGMPAAGGRTIKPGKLIRSGLLYSASDADIARLTELAGVVVDFRTAAERKEHPDPELAFATVYHLPILGKPAKGVSREEETDRLAIDEFMRDVYAAHDHMCRMYASFPVSDVALAGYRRFLEILAEPHTGAVLWHCTAGKDRAGFAAIIIQKILGVPGGAIARDYLFTNDCLAGEVARLNEMLLPQAPDDPEAQKTAKAALSYLFGAKEDYLDALSRSIGESWGSFNRFLERGLGVTPDLREQLRDMYLA